VLVVINLITASLLVPLQRLLLRDDKSDPVTFTVVSQLITGVLLLPLCGLYGFRLPSLRTYGLLMLGMFLLYAIGHYLYATTLKVVEASTFSTLLNTSTIWILATGYVVLQERPRLNTLLGATIIMISVFMLAKGANRGRQDQYRRSIAMGLLVGLIFGVAASLWVYIGRQADALSWTVMSFFGTPIIVFLLNPPRLVRQVRSYITPRLLAAIAILSIVWAVDNLASLAAYQRGSVSVVAPLLQVSVILSVLIAVFFLNERERARWKIAAALVCFCGVALIIAP